MYTLLFRKRNKFGELVRNEEDLPEGVEVDDEGMRVVKNPVAFSKMFRQVATMRGLDPDQEWDRYLERNPGLGRWEDN